VAVKDNLNGHDLEVERSGRYTACIRLLGTTMHVIESRLSECTPAGRKKLLTAAADELTSTAERLRRQANTIPDEVQPGGGPPQPPEDGARVIELFPAKG